MATRNQLPEISTIQEIQQISDELLRVETLEEVSHGGNRYPLTAIEIGSRDPLAPTLGLFGGVHGIERVGAQVVLSLILSLLSQIRWNQDLRASLRDCRIVSIPVVNPVGVDFGWRSNGNGVDLMRNAPVEATDPAHWLVGGHRLSPRLPWYRGKAGDPMELESQTLVDYVQERALTSNFTLTLDFHSGFGLRDRLWYPWARSREPFPFVTQMKELQELLDETIPYHVYQIEPQSLVYTTHGDLWDYLLDGHLKGSTTASPFIPLTLEMGSWSWVKKNPRQLFFLEGLFNPVKAHRQNRTLRRHYPLLQILLHAVKNYSFWSKKLPQ